MLFDIPQKSIQVFHEQGFIAFEDVLSEKQSHLLASFVDSSDVDRDLWRKDGNIKKIAQHRLITQIVKILTKKNCLRLLCDCKLENLQNPLPLSELFCFQGILCAALFRYKKGQLLNTFSKDVFFLLENTALEAAPDEGMYLIVYGQPKTLYIRNDRDPYTHIHKQFGYSFGDRLNDRHHPILL